MMQSSYSTQMAGEQQQPFNGADISPLFPSLQQGEPTGEEKHVLESDEFKMYFYKVIPCSKRCCHDWTTCPYAHPGEKAARRDPRLFNYVAQVCADMKKSNQCENGNLCTYAHNVFEYWLHPTKYRTQLCNDEMGCDRKICFFAHCLDELRVPAAYPRALSSLDTSQGTVALPATVRLKDALAQESTKRQTVTSGSPYTTSPIRPNPNSALSLPSVQSGIISQDYSNPQATKETVARTQDLLQQLQLMQAFKDVNTTGARVVPGRMRNESILEGWNSAGYGGFDPLLHRNSSGNSSSSFAPSLTGFPSQTTDLPSPPPPPPLTGNFAPSTMYQPYSAGFVYKQV